MSETIEEYKKRIASAGGYGRAKKMTAKQRKESASRAAQARWAKTRKLVDEITESSKALEVRATRRATPVQGKKGTKPK